MRRWVNALLPSVLIIVGWLMLAVAGAPYLAKISGLSSSDPSTFLRSGSESVAVNDQLKKFSDIQATPLIVVYEKPSGELSAADMNELENVNRKLNAVDGVATAVAPPIQSEDAQAAITVIPIERDSDYDAVLTELRRELSEADLPASYTFTGSASFAQALQNVFSHVDTTLLIVALTVVFIILLVVYRSPFLPFIVLTSALAALAAVVLIVYHLTESGLIQMNIQVQGILFVLVIGAATDYSLLYIARFREELSNHRSTQAATWAALKSSYLSIIAAGGTVTVGLLCLLLSDLGSNKTLGPVGGLGIALSVLAALTLLPSLLLVFGRRAFWPRKPKYLQGTADSHYAKNHPVWARIGQFVRRYPRHIWMTSVIVMLVACTGVLQLRADGAPQTDQVLGSSEARDGQKIIDAHFPPGLGSPAYVIAHKDHQDAVVEVLDSDRGVSAVSISVSDIGMDAVPVGKADTGIRDDIVARANIQRNLLLAEVHEEVQKLLPAGTSQRNAAAAYAAVAAKKVPTLEEMAIEAYPFKNATIKTVEDKILLQATLADPADSLAARDTISRLRESVRQVDSTAQIGGVSALQLDTVKTTERDLYVIMPVVLIAITIILMLLLRAVVAPLILLASTVLSFGAALGVAALVFNNVWQFAGVDPAVVLYAFVFLVALGIDYNIFLMTRVREETIKSGVAKGTIKGLVVTGGVITSAGVVLAATFASLNVIPMLFLVQIAFIVTFGVLLDTIVVRSLLVPALTLELDKKMWWPSKLSRGSWRRKKT